MLQKRVKRTIVLIFAFLFMILGLAGTVLPFVQGILFFAIGLILVSFCFPKVREWIERNTIKYPKLYSAVKKVEKFISRIIGEV